MKWIKNWKAKHPPKYKPWELEEIRLNDMLSKTMPGTEEYATLQSQLKMNRTLEKERWEAKKHLAVSDRGGIIKKLVGGVITIGGVILLGKYEADGNMFTGEKKGFADSFVRVLGNFFKGGD